MLIFLHLCHSDGTDTYDHRSVRTGHPVRSAIHKQLNGRLVLRWVTTWESLLLYVLLMDVSFLFSRLGIFVFVILCLSLNQGLSISKPRRTQDHHSRLSLLLGSLEETMTSVSRSGNPCQEVFFIELRTVASSPASATDIAELSTTDTPMNQVSFINQVGTFRKTHVIWLQPIVRAITRWHFVL